MDVVAGELSRRKFIRNLTAGSLALAIGGARLSAAEPDTVTVTLIHTADLHGHVLPRQFSSEPGGLGGMARVATQIRSWRLESPNSLLIDLGDLYQGAPAAFRSRGRYMIDCLNDLRYDAWVPGNHEFDWGVEVLEEAASASQAPLICANARLSPALSRDLPIAPFVIRDVGGIRVAVIGVTTPGMPFWLHETVLGGFEATDPVQAVRAAMLEVRAQRADLLVLACHMGLRPGEDDFANRIHELARSFPRVSVILGAHTHRLVPVHLADTVIYTQADFHGMHVGRVDIVMDRASRMPVQVLPRVARMDSRVMEDSAVLSLTAPYLEESSKELGRPMGSLSIVLEPAIGAGRPSTSELLLATAIRRKLEAHGAAVDGVLHGAFNRSPMGPGELAISDAWTLVPFDNSIVTVGLTRAELIGVMQEVYDFEERDRVRNLMGFQVRTSVRDGRRIVDEIRLPGGAPLDPGRRYRIACNSYDAQSAGRVLLLLRALCMQPSARMIVHPFRTRDALIELFRDFGTIGAAEISRILA